MARVYLETTAEAVSFCKGFVVEYFEFRSERTQGVGGLLAHVEGHTDMSLHAGPPMAIEHRRFVPKANLRLVLGVNDTRATFSEQTAAMLGLLVPILGRDDVAAGVVEGRGGDRLRALVWWNREVGVVVNSHPDPAGFDYYVLEALPAALTEAGVPYEMRDLGHDMYS